MLEAKRAAVWLAILGAALAVQGCWESEDQLTLLGNGGCRTADGGEGNPLYFSELTQEECKTKCSDGSTSCVAVEFNANNGMCEIHSEPITAFEEVSGVSCYVVK